MKGITSFINENTKTNSTQFINEIKAVLDKLGLKCVSVHQKLDFFNDDPQGKVDFLKGFGVKYVVVPWHDVSKLAGGEGWEETASKNSYSLISLDKGSYKIKVKANGKEDVKAKFGALYTAFSYGAPPHAGMAPGVDRMIMLIAEEDTIRDVIAFPLNGNAQDLMMDAPTTVSQKQLDDVHILINESHLN